MLEFVRTEPRCSDRRVDDVGFCFLQVGFPNEGLM